MRQGWTLGGFRGAMAALCGGLVLGLSCPGCPVPPTEQSLIQQATDRARTLDPDAIVFQVTGVNGASFDGTGSETLSYTFQALDPNDPTVMYELSFDKTDWTNAQTPLPV